MENKKVINKRREMGKNGVNFDNINSNDCHDM